MKLMAHMEKLTKEVYDPAVSKQACKAVTQINTSNKILLGMTQGIGNAILTTPLVQALTSMNMKVDILKEGLIRGAEQIFEGMDNVKVLTLEDIKDRIYLLGLQTIWPYRGLENHVAQLRFAPQPMDCWKQGIKAHEVECNMSLAYSLKYTGDIPSLYCHSSDDYVFDGWEGRGNIGIHVCRTYNHQFHANRQLRDSAGLGKALLDKGYRVFIIGQENAVPKEERDNNPGFVYALGMPLPEVASLIKEIDLMINEDSGIMHVTAAMDTPQIALFGPTSNIKNAPWSDRAFVARRNDMFCAPCQYTDKASECYNNECMNIDQEYILGVVDDMINNGI